MFHCKSDCIFVYISIVDHIDIIKIENTPNHAYTYFIKNKGKNIKSRIISMTFKFHHQKFKR